MTNRAHWSVLALLVGASLQPAPYETSLAVEAMRELQAVVETTRGTFVIDFLPDEAPNHVGYFIERAREGFFDGTAFHRVVRYGIIQGGDPLTRDPANRERYGTGGLGVLRREIGTAKHTRGAVSAVQIPGRPDSAGSQFFVCVTDQPALDGEYTVFGRVVEGMDVVEAISTIPVDDKGLALERVEIVKVTIRERPPPEPEPFSEDSPAELGRYRAVLETSFGPMTVELFADKAPEHVRNFLRLASVGAYDGVAFHRVVPGFVVQTGDLSTRAERPGERILKYVRTLEPEFNDTAHVKGVVSMAHGEDPASASTSFFICAGDATYLDGKYTAFGRVVDGLEVIDAIQAVPVDGETPLARVELVRVRIEKVEP